MVCEIAKPSRGGVNMSHEEVKDLGEVHCPSCKILIKVSKRVVWDRKEKRKKLEEELVTEKVVQATL